MYTHKLSQFGAGGQDLSAKKYMYEKLTKFPMMFAQKYFTPIFWWWGQMSLYPIFYTYEVYSGMLCVYLLQGVPGTWSSKRSSVLHSQQSALALLTTPTVHLYSPSDRWCHHVNIFILGR